MQTDRPNHYRLVVVGLGPAGLAIAHSLKKSSPSESSPSESSPSESSPSESSPSESSPSESSPSEKDDFNSVLFLEAGKPKDLRERYDPISCLIGEGGAGLYSDGKFSYPPAGSGMMKLKDKKLLQRSYQQMEDLMKTVHGNPVPWTEVAKGSQEPSCDCRWGFKSYPVDYLNINKREYLVDKMLPPIESICHQTRLVKIDYLERESKTEESGAKEYYLTLDGPGGTGVITADQVVLATGRFGPQLLSPKFPRIFRRYEIGFRVQAPSHLPVFNRAKEKDPKWIKVSGDYQFRSFCWCREGEVVKTRTIEGVESYSGRSDLPPTGLSNFGFNCRLLKEDSKARNLRSLIPFEAPLSSVDQRTINRYGGDFSDLFSEALTQLLELFPELKHPETTLFFPTIEGVGSYPDIDGHLKIPEHQIWCPGDCSGILRGIIPSFVSGYYVASRLMV